MDLDDYDYGNDDGRDNYCDNFNRVIEDNYMISWTHSVIEGGDDYFVQDYNNEDLYVDFFIIKNGVPQD